MKKITSIICDLDGVLWKLSFKKLGLLACKELEVPEHLHNEFANRIANAILQIPPSYVDCRITEKLVVNKLSEIIPEINPESLFYMISNPSFNYAKNNENALPVIKAIYKKGYYLSVRTNWFRSVQLANLGRFGYLPFFNTSQMFGMIGEYFKPHPKSLDSIILGKDPSQFAIVGDTPEKEVVLGNMLGITSIWLNETGQKTPDDKMLRPTFEICRIEELLDIL